MNRLKIIILISSIAGIIIGLSGCATHTWAPGPDVTDSFSVANAKCHLFARNAAPYVVVPNAAYNLGYGIGRMIRGQNDYNDCMAMSGWEAVN